MLDRPSFASDSPPLARLTTLGVGGAAHALLEPMNDDEVAEALVWAEEQRRDVLVLGGGSNVLAADEPFDGLVLRSADYGIEVERHDDGTVTLDVGAGVEWDELVAFCVEEGFAGLECLSGIPGRVGAAPIQNIGAYGQEVAERIEAVTVINRADRSLRRFAHADCQFGYRTSRFKTDWRGECVVTRVRFRLLAGGPATIRYPELARALGLSEQSPAPPLAEARRAVLAIRRRKSMVLDERDPNARSAGSFFMNPIVDPSVSADVRARAEAAGHDADAMPCFGQDDGRDKLSAAWLIERAGFGRGFAFGRAGLSSRHCLAIINRGGATAGDILSLASIVRRGVRATFGVTIEPEPVFHGFDRSVDELLR